METSTDCEVSSPDPERSSDPGSDLLLGSASSLISPVTATLSPAPPADWPCPPSPVVTTETNTPLPPPAAGSAPSDPPADTWMTSQLLAPPSETSQLIIVEQRSEHMVIIAGQSEGREVFVIPSNQLAVISSSPADAVNIPVTAVTDSSSSSRPISVKLLPAGAPCWALRLRNAEQKLGDSYRGFCCSEAELEAILLLHKQQTGCVFGTRQSPSVDKPATRLMWKSQYVPYDGIPFVNAGSRAIVMECQFGPRRKGLNKNCEHTYRATCPARIYIKKVRKFPEFGVPTEPTADKRTVKQEQEKAFQILKNQNLESGGVIRFYLQLPTERAHLYHTVDTPPIPPPPPDLPPPPTLPEEEEEEDEEEEAGDQDGAIPSRLHPRVAERIRQLVAAGHRQVYSVRKQLRRFVEKELCRCDGLPERHNLRYFPTVNDIKNHIHESQKALGLTSPPEWTEDSTDPLMETVTLTLTPAAQVSSDSLSPEAVQLFTSLSSLQPKIFAQLQGILLPLPPRPLSPLPPSSLLQTPVGESAGASGPEEELCAGERLGGGTQQVVLQNGENVQLQIITSAADSEEANQ
ncbi:calcium-responsive transcription factor isoform X3 [Dicentrarchus labrax]|uniref:calcium-responsive transcription factor isoform X3 n=1 Tax=Dicentrarchus labrax TaxID=13489 RepID=UPI0021F604C4|nr:calcium-responsive transcription factor isoform X3 [Dicentrarchus labrax]